MALRIVIVSVLISLAAISEAGASESCRFHENADEGEAIERALSILETCPLEAKLALLSEGNDFTPFYWADEGTRLYRRTVRRLRAYLAKEEDPWLVYRITKFASDQLDAVPLLDDMLSHPSYSVRSLAFHELGSLSNAIPHERRFELLRDETRSELRDQLLRSVAHDIVQDPGLLIPALEQPSSPELRRYLIEDSFTLQDKRHDPAPILELAHRWWQDEDGSERDLALRVFSALEPDKVTGRAQTALARFDEHVGLVALETLCVSTRQDSADLLAFAAESSVMPLRLAALKLLGGTSPEGGVGTALVAATESSEPDEVRLAAIEGMTRTPDACDHWDYERQVALEARKAQLFVPTLQRLAGNDPATTVQQRAQYGLEQSQEALDRAANGPSVGTQLFVMLDFELEVAPGTACLTGPGSTYGHGTAIQAGTVFSYEYESFETDGATWYRLVGEEGSCWIPEAHLIEKHPGIVRGATTWRIYGRGCSKDSWMPETWLEPYESRNAGSKP